MTMPTSAQTTNATGSARIGYASNQAGREPPEQRLRDAGRVRADHDHLAVRHVDDAEQADR